jgi:orotidine-5'-phosphate decarboxylase
MDRADEWTEAGCVGTTVNASDAKIAAAAASRRQINFMIRGVGVASIVVECRVLGA